MSYERSYKTTLKRQRNKVLTKPDPKMTSFIQPSITKVFPSKLSFLSAFGLEVSMTLKRLRYTYKLINQDVV